jgi:hypothetical protein
VIVITARWAAAFAWLARARCKRVDSHRGGGVRGSSCPASSSAWPSGSASMTWSGRRWCPGLSPARTVQPTPGTSGPSTPATGSHPLSPAAPGRARQGLPRGAFWGRGRRPQEDHQSSRDQSAGGCPACRGISQQGQESQATGAVAVVAHSASRLVLPKPEGATRITSGSPADGAFAARRAVPGAPWAGHRYSDQLALDGHAVSVRMALLPLTRDVAPQAASRRQVHPATGDPG